MANKILQITACTKGEYINIYGLADDSKVWRWDPVAGSWKPHKITPRDQSNKGDAWEGR